MPEGDTLWRTANRLRPALVGQPLVGFQAPRALGRPPRAGAEVTGVDAVGKHLLIAFADGVVLRTHLRMTGAWHLYRTGERWRKPAHLLRALVAVPGWEAVCFQAPVVELTHAKLLDRSIGHLGPDLTNPAFDDAQLDQALARMATIPEPDSEIAVVLLDQRVAAGIGNVYKSDVLWHHRVDPFTPLHAVPTEVRRALLATAARLLQHNVAQPGRRQTVSGGLAVYGRNGRPCLRCGTPVASDRQGDEARSTYWCPRCQHRPPPPRGGPL